MIFFSIYVFYYEDVRCTYILTCFKITKRLSMIGILGPINHLYQAPSYDHTQKFKNILVFCKRNITVMPHSTTN
jgi:hypothetical protein